MTTSLVWVEHEEGQLKDATLSAVTAAATLGEVHLVVVEAQEIVLVPKG